MRLTPLWGLGLALASVAALAQTYSTTPGANDKAGKVYQSDAKPAARTPKSCQEVSDARRPGEAWSTLDVATVAKDSASGVGSFQGEVAKVDGNEITVIPLLADRRGGGLRPSFVVALKPSTVLIQQEPIAPGTTVFGYGRQTGTRALEPYSTVPAQKLATVEPLCIEARK